LAKVLLDFRGPVLLALVVGRPRVAGDLSRTPGWLFVAATIDPMARQELRKLRRPSCSAMEGRWWIKMISLTRVNA
jgi:hypothetical protein